MRKNYILSTIFVTLFLDVLGGSMLMPLIPSLFTDSNSPYFVLGEFNKQYWYLIAGCIISIYGVIQFFAAPLFGDLSDNYGRKRVLSIGVGILALSHIIFSVAVTFGSITLIILSRLIAGAAGANLSVAQTVVSDITAPENRVYNFGLIGAALSLGLIIGPVLSGILIGYTDNPALPFLAVGVLGLLNFCLVMWAMPETNIHKKVQIHKFSILKSFQNIKHAFFVGTLRYTYGGILLQRVGFTFFTAFIAIFLSSKFNFTETSLGLFFGVVGISMVIVQLIVVRLVAKKYSELTILSVMMPTLAVVMIAYSFVTNEYLLFGLIPLLALSVGLINASFPAFISIQTSTEEQGVALGIHGSIHALSQGIAPLLAGFLVVLLGLDMLFIIGGVFIVVAWCTLHLIQRIPRPV